MTDKTSTARIVDLSTATVVGGMGRSAVAWRNDFLVIWAADHTGGVPPQGQTVKNAKWEKPRFEIHERETAKREYRAVLVERKANGQLKEVAAVRIGMFGKLLDKPAKNPVLSPALEGEIEAHEQEQEAKAAA